MSRRDIPPGTDFIGAVGARYEAGTHTKHGELGRLTLTAEQHTALQSVHWTVVSRSVLPAEADIAAHPENRWGLMIPDRNAVIVYAAGEWPRESTPETACIVFDARTRLPDAKPSVPAFIAGPTGLRLWVCAVSRPCPTWPVVRGDRVFIELTESRAYQISRDLLDMITTAYPERLPGLQAEHENEQCMLDCSAASALSIGWPDLATVTGAMAEHLNAPEAIAERTDHVATVPGGRIGDGPAMSRAEAERAAAAILDALGGGVARTALEDEKVAIGVRYMRGLLVESADFAERMIAAVRATPLGNADCAISGYVDPDTCAPLDPDRWLAMRQDSETRFVEAVALKKPGTEYTIQIAIERVGLRIAPPCHAAEAEVGFMLCYRFAQPDGSSRPGRGASPWITLGQWPPGPGGKAAAIESLRRGQSDTGEFARQIMVHTMRYAAVVDRISASFGDGNDDGGNDGGGDDWGEG